MIGDVVLVNGMQHTRDMQEIEDRTEIKMECNVGLISEYEERDPEYFDKYSWDYIAGVAEPDTDQFWVFVDQIAFFNEDDRSLELRLSLTVIHELIHLCGCLNENMTDNGVKLATRNEL